MACGKRVLITSKSPNALKVIEKEIANEVVGKNLEGLIMSWSDQERAHTFGAALDLLAELQSKAGHVNETHLQQVQQEIEDCSALMKRCEERYMKQSEFAHKSLNDIAQLHRESMGEDLIDSKSEGKDLIDIAKTVQSIWKSSKYMKS